MLVCHPLEHASVVQSVQTTAAEHVLWRVGDGFVADSTGGVGFHLHEDVSFLNLKWSCKINIRISCLIAMCVRFHAMCERSLCPGRSGR